MGGLINETWEYFIMRIKINRRPRERDRKELDRESEDIEGGGEDKPEPHDL